MKEPLSVWLVPVKEDEDYLSEVIKNLAEKYNSPVFTPHLTLSGDLSIDFEELKSVVDNVFQNAKQFTVRKTKISLSELFFKTVFIEFELNDILKNFFLAFSSKTDKRNIENFKPHISLIYKLLPEDEKLKIIDSLDIKDEFTIGSVYINAPKNGDKDFLNVEGWQTLYKKTLI